MAKTLEELQALEQPRSRKESFLSYLCSRDKDINTLPAPQSRSEEYLEYLCKNGGVGTTGGSGTGNVVQADPNTIVGVKLDGENLIFQQLGGNEIKLNLNLSNFANLNAENTFTKTNYMEDIRMYSLLSNNHYAGTASDTAGRYFGIKSLSSGLFVNGLVENIRLHLATVGEGVTSINGIKVWEVDKATNTYRKEITLTQPLSITVENNISYINIPIQQAFIEDTYFVLFLPSSGNKFRFKALSNVLSYKTDYVNTADQPTIGGQVPASTSGYTAYVEVGGNISVKNTLINVACK